MRWTDPVDGRPLRHARVWLDPVKWRSAVVGPLADEDVDALTAWIAEGRAVVTRRREPGADAQRVDLGVALPPAPDKRRIPLSVHRGAILRSAPPSTLDDVIDRAPSEWRAALRDLADRGSRIDARFHVYGSLAWQAISGESYVFATSDVDLLWTADGIEQLNRVLGLLSSWESDSGLRPDGELLLPDGDGIAWRELAGAPDRVLVKHRDRVSLAPWPGCWHARYADLRARREAA